MLPSFRGALRRSATLKRTANTSHVPRASLWTRARAPRRSGWTPVAAGALTLSAALMLGNIVRLDAGEGAKLKPKANAKQAEQAAHPKANSKPEEFLQAKEEEANAEDAEGDAGNGGGGGAFNPETGEINWDCPCLGGMAHGPCGPEFREAFSCFVYSEDEPKGINCVEKFKGMQDCFRRHPEVYGEEIMADDDEDDGAPSGTDSPGLEGESLPSLDPIPSPSPGTVSPSS